MNIHLEEDEGRGMSKKERDIFDRIMSLGLFDFIRPFYEQHKEILLYLFFGGLTFVVSISSYALCEYQLNFLPLVANIFSWILAVTFAYITNRIWVFTDTADGFIPVIRECAAFFEGRLATLALEEIILYVGVSVLTFHSLLVKIIAQILVIVSNYFISKLFVFRTKE